MAMIPELVPSGFVAITPSDTTVLEGIRGLFVGSGGTQLTVVSPLSETPVTFDNVPDGSTIWGVVTMVMNTDTDATGIVGLHV